MGQYYLTVNLDKKQFLDPHKFGDGLKLLEFGCSMNVTRSVAADLNLYAVARDNFEDVSDRVICALLDDGYVRDELSETLSRRAGCEDDMALSGELRAKVLELNLLPSKESA